MSSENAPESFGDLVKKLPQVFPPKNVQKEATTAFLRASGRLLYPDGGAPGPAARGTPTNHVYHLCDEKGNIRQSHFVKNNQPGQTFGVLVGNLGSAYLVQFVSIAGSHGPLEPHAHSPPSRTPADPPRAA